MFVLCFRTACWSSMPTQVSCDRIAEDYPWWFCLSLRNEVLFPMQSQRWNQYEVSLFLTWPHWPPVSHVDQQASGEDPESWKHGAKTQNMALKCYWGFTVSFWKPTLMDFLYIKWNQEPSLKVYCHLSHVPLPTFLLSSLHEGCALWFSWRHVWEGLGL